MTQYTQFASRTEVGAEAPEVAPLARKNMTLITIALIALFSQTPKTTVHFFYSPDCGHCMDMLLSDIPALQKKYRFQFNKYDIDILENYKLLEKMEEGVQNKGEDIPVVFVGDSVFYGPDSVCKKLGSTLKLLAPRVNAKDTIKLVIDILSCITGEINLYYFYQLECPECNRTEILLNSLLRLYPGIKIHRYDIFDDSSKVFYEALAQRRKIPDVMRLLVPAVFIGDDYLIKDIASADIESLIGKYKDGSIRLDRVTVDTGENSIIKRFSRFSILGIVAAGFLDGINPCAFATMIFFISYLLFIGRRHKEIMLMSISFITAVFVSYLVIGIGAYSLLKYLARFSVIAKILFLCFGIIAVIFGILSLYDYYVAQKGQTSKMILQLPLGIKQRIHATIKEKTKIGGIIIGSFVAGFIVSFLEFGCTGQVYLPTITFIISKAGMALKPLLALVLYNLMFIVPLIIISLGALIFTKENIARKLERRIPAVKAFTAIIFFVLGILLILSL